MFCFIAWQALRINILSRCPHVIATQVYNNLQISARRMQNYSPEIHDLPFHHVTIGQSQASSGARVAIVTVPSEDLREAMTMFQICHATQSPCHGTLTLARCAGQALGGCSLDDHGMSITMAMH